MWIKSTEGQWINSEHIIRIYLHDVIDTPAYGSLEESRILGRKALVDLANGHTMMLAYYADNGNLAEREKQFESHLQSAITAGQPFLDFSVLGYDPLPLEHV